MGMKYQRRVALQADLNTLCDYMCDFGQMIRCVHSWKVKETAQTLKVMLEIQIYHLLMIVGQSMASLA